MAQSAEFVENADFDSSENYFLAAQKSLEALSLKTKDSDVVFEGEKEIAVVYPDELNAKVEKQIKKLSELNSSLKELLKNCQEDYKKYNPKTTFIAYGASFDEPGLEAEEKYAAWCTANGVKPGEYYLSVGRLVPENNFYTMIREFMKSDTAKDFVLVADNEGNKFYDSLKETTGFEKDSRIKFVGTVYDTDLIGMIRRNAYGYFHGHSVGGTNPSLLEALATTQLNLLYDVGFNREVGEDGAVYWNLEEGNLKCLIESADKYDSSYIEALSEKAKNRIRTAYEWSYIVERYEETFLK